MRDKSVRVRVTTQLGRLGFDRESAMYIAIAVHNCIDMGIHPVDVVLTKHVYPELEVCYGRSKRSLETCIRRGIKKAYKENDWYTWSNELNYDTRPTFKKLVQLLLEQFDY